MNIEELDGMKPTVPRGKIDRDTLEKIEEDPAEWKEYDARRRTLEEKLETKRYSTLTICCTNTMRHRSAPTERQGTCTTTRPEKSKHGTYRLAAN